MIPKAVENWLSENQFGAVVDTRPVGGGCMNNGMVIQTDGGESFFLKVNPAAPADMFLKEVTGLKTLNIPLGPTVPTPYSHGADFLLMEDLKPAPRKRNYWASFGRQLAELHNQTAQWFGFFEDNYIGSTPQPNDETEDGYEFYAQQRLLYQANLANQRGYLGQQERKQIESVAAQLRVLIPEQPPSLLHGDLWSGNATTDSGGNPAIIDPAVHYGWAEAELAMTALFGAFPGEFYRAYEEIRPLEPGYKSRFPIYNLYHLLNHLNIFGRGYLGQVIAILRKYG